MKKIINTPEQYTDDMPNSIYAAHLDMVKYTKNDLRRYCIVQKKQGKMAVITGGGTGHLSPFLGYMGENLLNGYGVGGMFQSPCAEQIYNVAEEVESGTGALSLYGNYAGDITSLDATPKLLEMDGVKTASIVGVGDALSNKDVAVHWGVAGIFFMYKCTGARTARMGTPEEVLIAAEKVKDNTRIVGFALTPYIIPEIGRSNSTLADGEMVSGMGIHGESSAQNGLMKTADRLAGEPMDKISDDMPLGAGEKVCVLINGLGTTSQEEPYILSESIHKLLNKKDIRIHRTLVGEYAINMEMAGISVSIYHMVDEEMKQRVDMPVHTPFYTQV